MARPKLTPTQPLALKKTEFYYCDVFQGRAEDLIAAGLIERHMLPGQPGRNKASVTINGGRSGKYRLRHDGNPDYIQIARCSKRTFRVVKGLAPEELKRRLSQREEQQREKYRPQEPVPSTSGSKVPGSSPYDHIRAALATFDEPTIAAFEVGELAIGCNPGKENYGEQVEIVKRFGFHLHYAGDPETSEGTYGWGYVIRLPGGEKRFSAAGDLLDVNRKVRHIKRVK